MKTKVITSGWNAKKIIGEHHIEVTLSIVDENVLAPDNFQTEHSIRCSKCDIKHYGNIPFSHQHIGLLLSFYSIKFNHAVAIHHLNEDNFLSKLD